MGSMIFLHLTYPGFVLHYSILTINYNIWQTYALMVLLYIGSIVEAFAGVKFYNFIKKKIQSKFSN